MGSSKKRTYDYEDKKPSPPSPSTTETLQEKPRRAEPRDISPPVIAVGVVAIILLLLLRDGVGGAATTVAFPP